MRIAKAPGPTIAHSNALFELEDGGLAWEPLAPRIVTNLQNLSRYDLELDIAKFDYFYPKAYPNETTRAYAAMRQKVSDGVISLDGLMEHAVAIRSGMTRIDATGYDLCDGSDCKLASVRTHNYGESYGAPVRDIHQKQGGLRVAVYERLHNKMYLFLIPHAAYSHIPRSSNIEIPFELSGLPRMYNNCTVNWWKFLVADWDTFCLTKF